MTFPVDWVDNVTTDQQARTKDLHDRGGDVYFIIHHSVTRRIQDTIATFWSDREVSATWAIGPVIAGSDDIKIALTVPENRRPWTTASPLDDRACTTEVCDQELGGAYPVSANAKEKLAQIAAYMHHEYGMPLDRVHVLSHQEVYARGYGSYATACAGPDLNASLDSIVQRAIQLSSSNPASTGDEFDMATLEDLTKIVTKATTMNLYRSPNGSIAAADVGKGYWRPFSSQGDFNTFLALGIVDPDEPVQQVAQTTYDGIRNECKKAAKQFAALQAEA